MPTPKTHPYENLPIRLTAEEQQHPLRVIADFFDSTSLDSVREDLRKWYEAAISSDYEEYISGISRSNLFFVYNQMEILTEAAYVLFKNSAGKKKKEEKEEHHKKKRRNSQKA